MTTVRRSTTIQASPEAIWDYLADPSHWPQWDPDITGVETAEAGIVEGRTWRVRVNPGLRATLEFDDVEPNESFEWDMRALGGLVGSEAEFRMVPGDEPGLTVFHYEFELEGPLGQILNRFRPTVVAAAVEEGLANIAAAVEQQTRPGGSVGL